ncbi:MAG: DoxX family protein [Labilithrix sp.]|nr:DoxX family protein [Labilithrix sp.]
MKPLILLLGSFVLLLLAGRLGVERLRDGFTPLRWALALMFLFTAVAHFASPLRADLVRMVPPSFPSPELLVTFTGIFEIAGAIGLLVPRLARAAAVALALLLVAMFPANHYAATHALELGGAPVTPLIPRALLQLVFLAAVLLAGFGRRAKAAPSTPDEP